MQSTVIVCYGLKIDTQPSLDVKSARVIERYYNMAENTLTVEQHRAEIDNMIRRAKIGVLDDLELPIAVACGVIVD